MVSLEKRVMEFLDYTRSPFWRLTSHAHHRYLHNIQGRKTQALKRVARTLETAIGIPIYGVRDESSFKIAEGVSMAVLGSMAAIVFATVPATDGTYYPGLATGASVAAALGVYQVLYYIAEWFSRNQQRSIVVQELQRRGVKPPY